MIVFNPLRTRRLAVEFKELTIGDALYLLEITAARAEAGTTELLRRIIADAGKSPDIGQWTVQERAFAVSHYLAHVDPTGPNIEIGENVLSDYIVPEKDFPEEIPLGVVAGDQWRLVPLTGNAAEAIERLIASGSIRGNRAGWWFGAMAAQLWRPGEHPPEGDLDEAIAERVKVFSLYPDSDFMALMSAFLAGTDAQNHLLRLGFSDNGIVWMQEGPGLTPARFPFRSCISAAARTVFQAATATA